VGGSFATCPLANGSCPNFNNFETELQALGCSPGGDPVSNKRTMVCYNPPQYPPGVLYGATDTGTPIFNCGYGNDWNYALCQWTPDLARLLNDYDNNSNCQPVAPLAVTCLSATGLPDGVVVYYDPSCGGGCNLQP
jgi:hypothetical protein